MSRGLGALREEQNIPKSAVHAAQRGQHPLTPGAADDDESPPDDGPPEKRLLGRIPLRVLAPVAVVLAWYVISTVLIFTNRILLTGGLQVPISLTVLHMAASCLFANGVVLVGAFKPQQLRSRRQRLMVMGLAAAFGVSVVSGVGAFAYIPISFSELIGSTTPLFTAAFAYMMAGEVGGTWLSRAMLVTIALGAMMATGGEPSWHPLGFGLAFLSTVLRAFKAVLQQVLLQHEEDKLDSINLLRHISLYVILLLLPAAVLMEGPTQLMDVLVAATSGEGTQPGLIYYLALNLSAAFLVNWFQMQVTKMIGATILQVLGIFKSSASSIVSVLVFHNPVTFQSVTGYVIVVTSVLVYNLSRSTNLFTPRLTTNKNT